MNDLVDRVLTGFQDSDAFIMDVNLTVGSRG